MLVVAAGLVLGWTGAELITLIDRDDAVVDSVALVAASLILLAVILLAARRGAERLGSRTLGIRRTRFWPALGWLVAIGIGVNALMTLYLVLVGAGAGASGPALDPSAVPVAAAVLLVIGVAVAAPIAEEIVFRGYLFAALSRGRGGVWVAAAASSALFAAAHFLVYPPEILPALAISGFGLSLIFWFTGSLLPAIAFHSINNAIALATSGGWDGWAPLVLIGSPILSILILLPLASRQPYQARQRETATTEPTTTTGAHPA